ncbi:MAG: hypothetical protein BMS9Abin37_1575 [Acidobacteriota bacterium]|nr:MAG: hypothetical protein BMS9Abin37_1575 [Acidobacteriota bacterium]
MGVTVAVALSGGVAKAQTQTPESIEEPPVSRAGLLRAERKARVAEIKPPERTSLEKGLEHYDAGMLLLGTVQSGWHGVRLAGGEFPAGAGFNFGVGYRDLAVGSVYQDPDMPNRVDVDLVAATSTRSYHELSANVAFRNVGGSIFNFRARGKWYEFPEEDFFGLGGDAVEENRSSYLQRGLDVGGDFWLAPIRGFHFGGGATFSNPRIGSGRDPRFPSTEEIFDPNEIPGFTAQPDFVRFDANLSYDWRDEPLRPRSGGFYSLRASNYNDQDLDQFDFRQYEVDLQQYIPWMNRYRVVALRANVVISDADAGQEVPFYYMPHLGGGERLRGFREFRFRDRNSLLFTAEYRWEAWWALEMAVFADAGKVTAERSDLNLNHLKTTYGIGLRFHSSDAVSFRIDFAFSDEGFIPLLRYTHVF